MVKGRDPNIICLLLNYKVAYVSSPLNGCTTTKTLLTRAANHSVADKNVHELFRPKTGLKGLGSANKLEQIPDNWFTFTNVRNPYDRMVSFYEGKWKPRYDDEPPLYGKYGPYDWDRSFPEFTKWLEEFGLENVGKHAMTQWDNLRVPELDDVVRFENFVHDLKFLLKLNDVPFDDIPNLDQKPRRDDYSSYYDYEVRQRIERLYQIDLENLNYEF